MSTLIVCAVYDQKVGAFAPLMCVRSKAEAVRAFLDACGDPAVSISKHPADYQLYQVGSYEDQTGVIEPTIPAGLLMQGEAPQFPFADISKPNPFVR